jgi:hypothetical protein
MDASTGAKRSRAVTAANEQAAVNKCGFVVEQAVRLPRRMGPPWFVVVLLSLTSFVVGLGINLQSFDTTDRVAAMYDQAERPSPDTRAQELLLNNPPTQAETARTYEITSIQTRVTEQNDQWWKYAWVLKVRNDSDYPITLDAEIKWLDADGFVIETDSAYELTVPAVSEETFQDFDLIDMPSAQNVRSVTAETQRQ